MYESNLKKYWRLIIPVFGNICSIFLIITHTLLLKQGLVFFDLYSLKNYLITQTLLETIVIISIIVSYDKLMNKKVNKYVSFYLLHFPIVYVLYISFFYFFNQEGCLTLLFELYENKLLFILRVIITIITIIYMVRLSKKLNNQMLKFQFAILSLIILFTML